MLAEDTYHTLRYRLMSFSFSFLFPGWSVNNCRISTRPPVCYWALETTTFRSPVTWPATHLLEGFEEQNVFAGVLQAATLLVRFGVHHARLAVVVVVVVGIVGLGAHWAAGQTTGRPLQPRQRLDVSSAFCSGYWPETLRLYLPVVDSAKAVEGEGRRLAGVSLAVCNSPIPQLNWNYSLSHYRRLFICSWQFYNAVRIRNTLITATVFFAVNIYQ